ncbi:unnamed protein product [Calypogeia fissa]
MSACVVWIPAMAGSSSLASVASAGCGNEASRGFMQRVSFESAARAVGFRRTNPLKLVAAAKRTAATEQGEKSMERSMDTGLIFEPFRELQSSPSAQVPETINESYARQRYDTSCESAINDQINVEYNASYIYHAMFSYFDRDNVALPGLANYFREQSEEEREHAEQFMTYQNKRGGRVKLQSILLPQMEFANAEKGDALYAMELTLSLEKLVTEKLYTLHEIAEDAHDVQLANYVKSHWLSDQIEDIKKVSKFVAQLRRIGRNGHGVYYWDRQLLEEEA